MMLMFMATPSTKGSFVTHVLPASLVAAVGMSLAYIPALMSLLFRMLEKKNPDLHLEL
jgi:hypothetical protein